MRVFYPFRGLTRAPRAAILARVGRWIDGSPWLVVAAMFGAMIGAALVVAALGGSLSRLVRSSGTALGAAFGCFAVVFAVALSGALSERQTGWLIAAGGAAGLLFLVAASGAQLRERTAELGMAETRGFPVTVLESDAGGVRARLRLEGGRPSRRLPYERSRRAADDELEIEADVPGLAAARVSAERLEDGQRFLPAVLVGRLDGLLDGSGVNWRDQRAADGVPAWGEEWRFWESAPQTAARVFGRARPPDCSGLRLTAVGVRGGLLRCEFSGFRIDRAGLDAARAATREFAARLNAGGAPPVLG